MSTENALVTLLREGVSVNEESVDSKRDLEEALRNACNGFIDHICNVLAKEMFEMVSKLNDSKPESLTSASFFEANSVKKMLAKTLEEFDSKVTDILNKMSVYLENSTTQSILMKPVSKKISKGLEEIKKSASGITGDKTGWDESTRSQIYGIINDLEKTVKKLGRLSK